jgi:hypothetical protein
MQTMHATRIPVITASLRKPSVNTSKLNPVFQGLISKLRETTEKPIEIIEQVRNDFCGETPHTAFLVNRVTPRVTRWATELIAGLKASGPNDKKSNRYSQLNGCNFSASDLKALGVVARSNASEVEDIKLNDPENVAYQDRALMAVLVGPNGLAAIGYCMFVIRWVAPAYGKGLEMVVELCEVWIKPEYRKMGLSESLAMCVSRAVHDSLKQIEAVTVWGRVKSTKYDLTFLGDVLSDAGEQFLLTCLNRFEHDADLYRMNDESYAPRLKPSSVMCDAQG